jgi:BMFP domain-containing protein YqiC
MFKDNAMPEYLSEIIKQRILTGLEGVGRDQQAIRQCLGKIVEDLGKTAGEEDWSAEYLEYLLHALYHACITALDVAVAREEYEWAAELFYRVKREAAINKL